ncbi:LOW QUALITY PROTEIN: RRM_1 domain-containing protein, partial [Cephalotus follicularis]
EQVEIKRTIPKGSGQLKDFKTTKIFVGGIPVVYEDELENLFKYGKVVEHQIIRDHETNRSRGFRCVIFDNEEVVDEMFTKGNMIDMAGTQV